MLVYNIVLMGKRFIIDNINKKILFPIIIAIIISLAAYWIPQSVVDINKLTYVNTFIDDLIPFFSPAVVIYVLAFVQWAFSFYILLTQDTLFGKRICAALAIGSIFCFIIFILFPTSILRNNVEPNNFFNYIISFLYSFDAPVDILPSFHCMYTTLSIIVINHSKELDNKFKIINVIFSVLVFTSMLLTKQHCFVDVPSGVLVAYIFYLLSIKLIKE